MTTETKFKVVRADIMAALYERDGAFCTHPECKNTTIDTSLTEGPWMGTIDHTEPQSWCYDEGWTREEVWAMSNLTLMHRTCNADKGDRRYREDGTLPPKPKSRFRYSREKKAQRPDICTSCNAGRLLDEDEVCASCGSGPMPERMPMWKKLAPRDCDHAIFWCPMCASGIIERPAAVDMAVLQGESGEWDDILDEER